MCLAPSDGFSNPEITLNERQSTYDLLTHHYILEDPKSRLTPQEILKKYSNDKSQFALGNSRIKGASSPFWVIVPVRNLTHDSQWYLNFGKLTDGRAGVIEKFLIYEANKRDIIFNGLQSNSLNVFNIIDKTIIPIEINKNEDILLVFYFMPSDYKKLFLPLSLTSEIAQNDFVTFAKIFYSNFNLAVILSMAIILLAFIVTKGVTYISIILFFALILLWHNYIEAPIYLPILDIISFTHIYPLILGMCIIVISLFTLPQRYSIPVLKNLMFFAFIASVMSIIGLSFFQNSMPTESYSIGLIVSGVSCLISICFLYFHSASFLKKTTLCMAGWVGLFLLGMVISALATYQIIPTNYFTLHADKIVIYPQFILLFIGVIYSIQVSENTRIYRISKQAQKAQSLLQAQKNKDKTDHSRLLRVIEREREIMEELRARESDRTEEMRNAKVTADEANQAKSAFLAVVSHEIRTPMTGIMGMIKMLEDTDLSSEQKDYLMTIKDSGDAMLALLNDILDFSKIEDGSLSLENIEFNMKRVVNSVSMLMRAHADQKNLRLILDIDDSIPPSLYGDPTRLRQVILNLVGNAIKFTPKGHIKIKVESISLANNTNHIAFEIEDTGLGISPEAQDNLFQPFAQADSSISRKYGGTGLGLTICKTLVEAMGGKITLESKVDIGTKFSFTLPFYTEQGEAAIVELEDVPTIENMRFMVVDDNEINRKVVQGFLKKSNNDSVLLSSGKEALDVLATDTKFDAILADIEMPGMSGIDLVQHILDDETINQIPVIAITGNVSDDNIKTYKNAGFKGYVAKPIEIDLLYRAINNVINPQAVEDVKSVIIDTEKKSEEKPTPITKSAPTVGKTLDEPMINGLKMGLGTKQTEDLMQDLFDKTAEILEQLEGPCTTDQDKDAARMRAHELRGMASNFGLKALSDKAHQIEQIAKDADRPFNDIIPHIKDLSTLVERSKYSIQEFLGLEIN